MEVRDFTDEMLEKLQQAHAAVQNTSHYMDYMMDMDSKDLSGDNKWVRTSHCIPSRTGVIKEKDGKLYIIIQVDNNLKTRYYVTNKVEELLGLQKS